MLVISSIFSLFNFFTTASIKIPEHVVTFCVRCSGNGKRLFLIKACVCACLAIVGLDRYFSNSLFDYEIHRRPHPTETIFLHHEKIFLTRNLHFRFFKMKKKNFLLPLEKRVELFTVRVRLTQP